MDSKEEAVKRSRLTLYLLLAGSAVLLVPLLILLYLRSTEGGASGADAGARAFARRENRADRINAAQTPAPQIMGTAAGSGASSEGGSLSFVKSNPDLMAPPQPSTETAKAPESAPSPAKEVAKAAPPPQQQKTKTGPKPFVQPRLQGTKFSSTNFSKGFGSTGQRGGKGGQMGGKGGMPGGMPQMPGGAGMPDMGAMMQGMMPGGAGGAGGAAGGGMPDMSSLMKGMMPGPSAVGGGTAGTAQPGTTTK